VVASTKWERLQRADRGCPAAKGYVQHGTSLKANLYVQQSTDLGLFRLTVLWILNSSVYNGLPVRTTAPCPTPAEWFKELGSRGCSRCGGVKAGAELLRKRRRAGS